MVVVRLLRANLRKLVRRPATWVTLLPSSPSSRSSSSPSSPARGRSRTRRPRSRRGRRDVPRGVHRDPHLILGIGGLLAVTYGGAVGGSEWGWGTLKAAVARGESRSGYTLLDYAAVAVFVLLGMLVAFASASCSPSSASLILGVSLSGMTDPDGLLRSPELFARAGSPSR